ncbi:MAG: type I methionyl aminopeptidase [Candidatus Izemoplasmatales bacterium]|nr:type I methionyl aminopeptidase [Candidatus Izemoplasmatales bacterium]
MITIKSEREILLMRQAGLIVYKAHQVVLPWIKPGVSTHELDDIIESAIRKMSATPSFKNYNGFPAASCISINEEVIHGIPSKKKILKEGDLVSIDIGANYKGYHGDSAWSYGCGKVSEETRRLLEGTKASLFEGLKQAKAGNRLSDISHAIQMYAEGLGFSVVREFVGHGIGKNLHEDPAIPNYGLPGRGVILRPGMTIAIEPMINFGRKEVRVLADGWTTITADGSLSAHFEHTVLITETGCDIFTTQGKEE